MATKSLAPEVRAAAQRHRDTASSFTDTNSRITNEVDGLRSINRGELMDALDRTQNAWSEDLVKVIKQIQDMADYLDMVAGEIEGKDSDLAGNLR